MARATAVVASVACFFTLGCGGGKSEPGIAPLPTANAPVTTTPAPIRFRDVPLPPQYVALPEAGDIRDNCWTDFALDFIPLAGEESVVLDGVYSRCFEPNISDQSVADFFKANVASAGWKIDSETAGKRAGWGAILSRNQGLEKAFVGVMLTKQNEHVAIVAVHK